MKTKKQKQAESIERQKTNIVRLKKELQGILSAKSSAEAENFVEIIQALKTKIHNCEDNLRFAEAAY